MFNKILVANDGSEGAKKALQVAVDVAKRYQADLHQLSVEEHLPHYAATVGEVVEAEQEAGEYFRKVIKEAKMVAGATGLNLTAHVLPGHEVETIVTFTREYAFDLLVIGFTGHSNVLSRIWGSTSQNLTKLSPCPVMVVK